MKYFIMTQDKRLRNVVQLKEFPTAEEADFDTSYADKVNDNTVLHTVENETSVYPDVFLAPLYLVEDKIYRVAMMYDETLLFKKVSLVNMERATRKSYWLALLDRLDCLHSESRFYPDHSVEHLILDKDKIRGKEMFKIHGISPNWVVVSMNIAESVLRRTPFGVRFEEVEVR